MTKTASVLAEELDKLAGQLEAEANSVSSQTSSSEYIAGLVQGMGLDGKESGV